jgi:putative heme-binding domain-containing protein
VQPGALEEVGMAANAMARDPKFANSDFSPAEKQSLILQAAPMIGPTRKSLVHVLRFQAPTVPGIYPFVCTFPGHWVIMKGAMVVANDLKDVEAMLAAEEPQIVREWRMTDFDNPQFNHDEQTVMQGMQAFMKARCHQCHAVAGHGVNLGPDLRDVAKRFRGRKLLEQLVAPSIEINPKYQTTQFLLVNGKVISGVIIKETSKEFHLITNLLTPEKVMRLKKSSVDETIPSKISPMPAGLLNVLTKEEIHALVGFLESGGFELPDHLKHNH